MNLSSDKPFMFDRMIRVVSSILVISGIIYLIALLRNALLPFLIARLLAHTTQPFVKFFQYKSCFKGRTLSIMAVLVTLRLLIALLMIMVVPSIAAEAGKTLELIRTYDPGEDHVPLVPHSRMEYLESNVSLAQIMELLSRENLLKAVKQIIPWLWSILSNTFLIPFSIMIVFMILLYFILILLDYGEVANSWVDLIPEHYRPFLQGLAEDVEYSMNRYSRGQPLITLFVGTPLAIGSRIINFSLMVMLGLFIGVLNLIPYTQAIDVTPMILSGLLRSAETGESFWLIFGLVISILGIIQCIQDLYLTPRIMGKAMGLGPAIILLLLSIQGIILGSIGLIIVLPLTTLCLSHYK